VTLSVSLRRLVNGGGSQSGSFHFLLNDKCHCPPGPHWVWRSDVTTVKKSLVLVRHDSGEEIDPAFSANPFVSIPVEKLTGAIRKC
jgi:hypothetical protein